MRFRLKLEEFDERLLRVLVLVDVTEWLKRLGWMRECEYR